MNSEHENGNVTDNGPQTEQAENWRNRQIVSPRLWTSVAGALAVIVGGMVLVGWALDIAALKSILPGCVSMKPNTAIAFILTGIALLFHSLLPLTLNAQRST